MRRSYEDSVAMLSERVEIIGDPQPVINSPPKHDDETPGPSIFRLRLEDVSLANLTLAGLYISRSELTRVSFSGSDLHFSTLNWSDFVECDFSDAVLTGADLRACRFVRCLFQSADLSGADLRLSSFEACAFANAAVSGTKLYRPRKLPGLFKASPGHEGLSLSAAQYGQINWCDDAPEPGGG